MVIYKGLENQYLDWLTRYAIALDYQQKATVSLTINFSPNSCDKFRESWFTLLHICCKQISNIGYMNTHAAIRNKNDQETPSKE